MTSTESDVEDKAAELPIHQIESESIPVKIIKKTKDDSEHKKQTKRKKSTSIDGICIEDGINYTIFQHENKRQKIEIPSKCKQKSIGEGREILGKTLSASSKPKDAKNNIETNKLRLKYENIHTNTVQKLNAQAEQLRMEISTLRTALANEQSAVRVLR